MTNKTLYAVAFTAVTTSALFASSVQAVSTVEERDAARTEVREARDAARAEHQDERETAREENREERDAAREEVREEREEEQKERGGERADKREGQFDSRWARMSEKLTNVVSRLSEAGADTTELESAIDTLEGKADNIKSAFSDLDTTLEGDDRDAVTAAKEAVRVARDDMKSYFSETVRPLIKELIDTIKSENSDS